MEPERPPLTDETNGAVVIEFRDDLAASHGVAAVESGPASTAATVVGLQSGGNPQRDFSNGRLLGSVTRVDRDRVRVTLVDPDLASHVSVSELVAVPAGET